MRKDSGMTKIGTLIFRARKKQKYTQLDVAEYLGHESVQYISNIERGLCSLTPHSFKLIGDFLEITKKSLINASVADYRAKLQAI